MRIAFPSPVAAAAALLLCGLSLTGRASQAQCLSNHLVVDGLPSSQRDCQPLANLTYVSSDQMSSEAQDLVNARHADLIRAAGFYGYDLTAPGWVYEQAVSPIIQKHLILSYTVGRPAREAAHFVAVVPADTSELVQVVPSYAHGLRLFDPGWQKKGTFAVYNRLLRNEGHVQPIATNMEWIDFAALYLALTGGDSAIPTETDSIKATWDLAARRATTPVITIGKNGKAIIAFSDIGAENRTISWKLSFDRLGQIDKAERQDLRSKSVKTMLTAKDMPTVPPPARSALNPSVAQPAVTQ